MLFQSPIFTWEVQKCVGFRSPGLVSSTDGLVLLYRVPKSGDGHFYLKSLYGLPRDFRENTGISLQSAPKLSANGPMMPQKYCQKDEDFNFQMKKFSVATLSKFLQYEQKREIQLNSECHHSKYKSSFGTQISLCAYMVEISKVLPLEISPFES